LAAKSGSYVFLDPMSLMLLQPVWAIVDWH